MSRLLTTGFEISSGAGDNAGPESDSGGTGDTTTFRSGARSLSGGIASNLLTVTRTSRTLWLRGFLRFSTLPTATFANFGHGDGSAGAWESIRLATNGKWQLWFNGAQVGSDSAVGPSTSTWYRVELSVTYNASNQPTALDLRIDGSSVCSGSTVVATPGSTWFTWTFNDGDGVGNLDDLALNDDQGASQNTWPGDGKVVLLKPISDSQDGSWRGGADTTGIDLSAAVDNTPPTATNTGSDTITIESIDSSGDNATDEYRANLTTYTTAGIASGDTINVLHPVINHGEQVATGTKTGSFGLQSNPAAAGYDTFTFGDDVGASANWPTSWRWKIGTPVYAPAPTLGSSPILAVRKTDTGTRVVQVAFMGVYCDYTPAAVGGGDAVMPYIGGGYYPT